MGYTIIQCIPLLHLFFQTRHTLEHVLCLALVTPQVGVGSLVFKLSYLVLFVSQVKDASE